MRIVECVQGSPEWEQARCGIITASRISDILAQGRGGAPSASRKNYMMELLVERLTWQPAEHYRSQAMERGSEEEAGARTLYEFRTDAIVTEVGLVLHPTLDYLAASPDGLVGDDGLVEIKNPNTAQHVDTLLNGTIKGEYQKQMQGQLLCTERDWCDFTSHDSRLPADVRLVVIRVNRDEALIKKIEYEAALFWEELLELERKVRERGEA